MAKPFIHAQSSAKAFGGVAEDYLAIHDFMDSSNSTIADHRHRALTHNSWFISTVIERVFGHTITVTGGKRVSTRDVAERHVLEDFRMKFIPSAVDFLMEMEPKPWMNNGNGCPPSYARVFEKLNGKLVEKGDKAMSASETLKQKKDLAEQLKGMRKKMKDEANEFFVELLKPVFDAHPKFVAISWRQYTPGFNDGDPCVFRSTHDYLEVLTQADIDEGYDDEEAGADDDEATKVERDAAEEAFKAIIKQFDDDDMEAFFGDGSRVTIFADRILVEEYDCGY